MTGTDDPFVPPDMTHVMVDTDLQMQKYLADIAMEDILLSPPPSARKERAGGLMAQYRKEVADELAIEAQNDSAQVVDVEEIVEGPVPLPGARAPGAVREMTIGTYTIREFVGKKEP